MAGGKETPRQKMIGMMYLVLTALLALNVSNEVLDGFVKVEKSLLSTSISLTEKSESNYAIIQEKYASNTTSVGPFFDEAKRIAELSDALEDYLNRMKAYSLAVSQGDVKNIDKYLGSQDGRDTCIFFGAKADGKDIVAKKDENQEITTFLGLADPKNPLAKNPFHQESWGDFQYTALELRENLEAYKNALISTEFTDHLGQERSLSPAVIKQLEERFTFPGGSIDQGKIQVDWEAAAFWHVPIAAVEPLLTKLILDVKEAESDALTSLLSGIDAKSYKFTDLKPLVVPMSSIVMKGDTLRADVLLSAFDPTKKAEIYVEDANWSGTPEEYTMDAENVLDIGELSSLELDSLGIGKLAMPTKNLAYGDYVFRGVLNHTKPDGSPESIKFVTPRITVSQPALVVSPTKMNVFYRGLENPVEISVPGVAAENIRPSINNGHKLKRTSSGWVVIPNKSTQIKSAVISVVATLEDGSEMRMPPKEFRIKSIPNPDPSLGDDIDYRKPTVSKATLAGPPPVKAILSNFEFEVKPKVTKFSLTFKKNGSFVTLKSNNSRFTTEMKEVVRRFRVGDSFYLEDIEARMPDESIRPLPSLKLNVGS